MILRALLSLMVLAASLAATQTPGDELLGLWKAKRWFGPEAHGALVIQRSGTTYTADIAGHVLPVRVEKGELTFELPNHQGSFRGKREGAGVILGQWYPPPAVSQRSIYVSPVQLKPAGPNRWNGQVQPFDDVFTFYLLVHKRPDGSLSAFLRNPERDLGSQLGVERIARDGDVVRLFGRRQGQAEEREAATGTYDTASQVITLGFPSRGGSYDFRRDDDQSDFYPRGKNPRRYAYHPPLARDDGWPTGTLEQAGIDRPAIERFIQMIIDMPMAVDSPWIEGMLIARHGKLVLEECFHGQTRDKFHETRSAGKSVTATIVGAAMQAGEPVALSAPVYKVMNGGTFPPDLEPRKRAMTLENLLTMSSGYYCDDADPNAPGGEEIMINQD